MSVPFRRAFEGAGSNPISYKTTFLNLHTYIDVRVVFYALFYVFPIRFRNGMSNCTYHN